MQIESLGIGKERAAASGIALVLGGEPGVFLRRNLVAGGLIGKHETERGRGDAQSNPGGDEPASGSIHGEQSHGKTWS